MENNKSKQKQHIIDMIKADEELGLYEEPKQDLPGTDGQIFKITVNKDWFPKQETTLEEHNYLQGFINQFEEEGEHQELSNDDWTVSRFLEWMKLNNFKIVKTTYSVDDYKRDLKEKVTKAIDIIQELPIDEVSKQGGISALKLILNE
jgi:hypothetical protein